VGAGDDFRMSGVELGGSVGFGAVSLLANIQSGKGLGVLADGDSGDRKQTAVLVQATFQATPDWKLGELDRTESSPVVGDKARQNGVSLGAILFF
jgi:hypothetical protein